MARIDLSDRLTFYRNWYRAARGYSNEMRLAFYDAVCAFAFDGVVPPEPEPGDDLAAHRFAAVQMVKEGIRVSRSKRKVAFDRESKRGTGAAQTRHKRGTTPQQEKEQEQVKEQEQEREGETPARSAVIERMKGELAPMMAKRFKAPAGFLEHFLAGMGETGWTAMREGRVFDVTPKNLAHIMRGWLKQFNAANDSEKKICGARVNAPTIDDIPIAR